LIKLTQHRDTLANKHCCRLEHVQEFTRQLDESEDEEEEEDDMPTLQLKHGGESPTSTSDKVSVSSTYTVYSLCEFSYPQLFSVFFVVVI